MPNHDLEVLTDNAGGRDRWVRLLRDWSRHEVYAHPSFLSLFAGPGDSPRCLRYEDHLGEVLYPMILRDLDRLPFVDAAFGRAHDAVSTPYGYGGPFVRTDGDTTGLVRRFHQAYRDWARDVRLVSEYTTFSPATGVTAAYPGDIGERMPVVVKALDTADILSDIKRPQREAIRRADRLGVVVEVDTEGRDAEAFIRLCSETSTRRGGFSGGHAVSREFTDVLLRELGDYVVFFHARLESRIVSSVLVLLSGDTVVAFRGGTASDALNTRANQLLQFRISDWGRQAGYRWYLLGGGNTAAPSDPLFVYKKSFATTGVRMLNTGKWMAEPEYYDRLVTMRRRFEEDRGAAFEPVEDYFPAYRAPSAEQAEGV